VLGLQNFCNLLFELSNEDRLGILHKLNKNAMNVTRLSKKLNLTTQESSRHVSRLGDVGLIQKDIEGSYHLTFYGKLVLQQIEGLTFTAQHRNYFSSHTLVHLPPEFISRIGDLAGSANVSDVSDAFYRVDKLINEAEEYIWTITDQYLISTAPLLRDALKREVKIKNIEIEDWIVPPTVKQAWYSQEATPHAQIWTSARTTGLLEERVLGRLEVYLYMSEKEVAGLAFPLPNGRFDYLGFAAKNDRSHNWCHDLFQYYWQRARSRKSIVEELYEWIKKRPKVIHVLEEIAKGAKIAHGKELISELESKILIKQGKLTLTGDFLYERLRKETPR
jgi:predicted transcriptional regulator